MHSETRYLTGPRAKCFKIVLISCNIISPALGIEDLKRKDFLFCIIAAEIFSHTFYLTIAVSDCDMTFSL